MELADIADLKSADLTDRAGSSPASGTIESLLKPAAKDVFLLPVKFLVTIELGITTNGKPETTEISGVLLIIYTDYTYYQLLNRFAKACISDGKKLWKRSFKNAYLSNIGTTLLS